MTDPVRVQMSDLPKYRVWWIPQVPGKPFTVDCDDVSDAIALIDVLAKYDLFQYDQRIKPDYSNAGGIEVWDDGEWTELDEEEYDDALSVLAFRVSWLRKPVTNGGAE